MIILKKRQVLIFKFKRFLTNIKEKRIILSIISVLLLIGLVIGVSYAILEYQTNKSVDNLLTTTVGELSITFSSNSNTIALENAQPVSDQQGLLQAPYTFTVSSSSSYDVYFVVKLNEFYYNSSTHDDTGLQFPDNTLKINVDNGTSSSTNYLTNSYTVVDDTIPGQGTQNKTYSIRIWIDENAGSEVSGKHYHGRIELINSHSDQLSSLVQYNLKNNLFTPAEDTEQTFIVGTASDDNYEPNNYLWYSGKMWRILALNKTDGAVTSIKVITQNLMTATFRNGTVENGGSGLSSIYENSYMYQWLNEDFYDTLRSPTNFVVTNYLWNATQTSSVSKPLNTTMVAGNVGSLNLYEYVKSYTNTTAANGYLNLSYNWWLINPHPTTDWANFVDSNGYIGSDIFSNIFSIRPAINLKPNLLVVKGNGTSSNPYRLEGDNDEEEDLLNDNLNTRYSGEYVRFNNEDYRIMKIEGNLTKIVKVDYLKSSGENLSLAYASGSNYLYSSSISGGTSYWGGYLNTTWYDGLSTSDKNMVETGTWYSGVVTLNTSYKKSICETVAVGTLTSTCGKTTLSTTAKVGLIRLGEMFSSQLGDIGSAVNFRLLTPYSTSGSVFLNQNTATTATSAVTTSYATRQTLYLKSNVKIVSGDGTPDNPFIIEGLSTILDKINSDLSSNLYTPSGDTDQTFIVGTSSDTNYKPNNYLWYSGKLWRIVALNKTSGVVTSVKIITQNLMSGFYRSSSQYDLVYYGSYMYQWFKEDFYDTLRNPTNFIVTNYLWNATAVTNSNKPPTTTMVAGNVGSLNGYEYVKSYTNTTAANGYLNLGCYWFLISPESGSSNGIWSVSTTGAYSSYSASNRFSIRPAVNLKADLCIVSGNGTSTSPYRLEGDNDQEVDLLNDGLNTRYSGEYVKFAGEDYRIMKVEGSLTKIVKVDYLKSEGTIVTKAFAASSSLYSASISGGTNYWGGYLNTTWYGSLSTDYQNMIETGTWYSGTVGSQASYKLSICATVTTGTLTSTCTRTTVSTTAKIGLIRLGEMFSSHLAISGEAASFRLLTPDSSSTVFYGPTNANIFTGAVTTAYATRPTFYLKAGVYITDGDGTPSNPFTIAM